jgi:hypothetical protein
MKIIGAVPKIAMLHWQLKTELINKHKSAVSAL